MNATIFDTQPTRTKNKIHPQKFALWIAFASIFMMFAAFTSAYMVRKAAGDWLEFQIPDAVKYNVKASKHNAMKHWPNMLQWSPTD